MRRIELTRPDDWHVHLRDGDRLPTTVRDTGRVFGRAICMPNLTPPVTTVAHALEYREQILAVARKVRAERFDPLMTLYLTDDMPTEELERAAECPHIHAVKLYPAGATTNSAAGVTELEAIYPLLEAMERVDLPLLIHGEVTDDGIDIFERERIFIERHLAAIVDRFRGLRVVLEHITTRDAVDFVRSSGERVAATITAHHLLYNRNDMLVGGIRPDLYCLPILKRREHQRSLLQAATSGIAKFFLGTDSAPHPRNRKHAACGCAGVYTAHTAMEFYAEAFDSVGALDRLEGFASHFGADFYGLPRNSDTITLIEKSRPIPERLDFGGEALIPLRASETLQWSLES